MEFCDQRIKHDGVVVNQRCRREPKHSGLCLPKSLYVSIGRQEWVNHAEEGVWSENLTDVCFTNKALIGYMYKHQLNLRPALDAMLRELALTQINKCVSIDT